MKAEPDQCNQSFYEEESDIIKILADVTVKMIIVDCDGVTDH